MTNKQIIIDEINKTIEQEMENLRNIAKQQIGKLEAKLKSKEQELQEAMDNYVQLDLQRVKEYNELVDLYKAKEQECEELKSDLTDLSKIVDCKNGTILTFKEQLDKLKQTLAEIKEICNEYQKEYILNIGVEILTNKILKII